MHIYVIVAFVFGVVASVVAYGKGRNSLGWFVAGLLIGPFSLIVTALPRVANEGRFVHCPACAEVIHAEAIVCRFCEQRLDPAGQEPA